MSVKWRPATGHSWDGLEPLRWESTAFNLDWWAMHVVRWFFDGYGTAYGAPYSAGQEWNSIGAWFEPGPPWGSQTQVDYETTVQGVLAAKPWQALPPVDGAAVRHRRRRCHWRRRGAHEPGRRA